MRFKFPWIVTTASLLHHIFVILILLSGCHGWSAFRPMPLQGTSSISNAVRKRYSSGSLLLEMMVVTGPIPFSPLLASTRRHSNTIITSPLVGHAPSRTLEPRSFHNRYYPLTQSSHRYRTSLPGTPGPVGQPGNSIAVMLERALTKFQARPGTYMLIPFVAALVGWFTNWLAVQMIFYPITYKGVPLYRKDEVPLGMFGWQGIVPCKTRPMTEAMVDMVTSQLLTVKEAFARLEPRRVAQLLGPEVPKLTNEILKEILPKWVLGLPSAFIQGLDNVSQSVLKQFTNDFLQDLTRAMQANIDSIFDIRSCVVQQMMEDRSMLGQLFRKCGQKELDFLTNSGLWFGFMLGIIQMIVALFWDNPWSLSIGGGIVGLATNWLALKWIFEPVNPVKVGPFTLQGQFLRRQKEVSAEFSKFFATRILTSEKLWHSVLNDPGTKPAFQQLFAQQFQHFVHRITRGFGVRIEPETLQLATNKAVAKLPEHVPVLYDYMDSALGLEDTLRVRMEKMSSEQFERVLHPIFEEDELTLILAGAALGFAAGLIQQALETGKIKAPDIWTPLKTGVVDLVKSPRKQTLFLVTQIREKSIRVSTNVRRGVADFVRAPRRQTVAFVSGIAESGKRKWRRIRTSSDSSPAEAEDDANDSSDEPDDDDTTKNQPQDSK